MRAPRIAPISSPSATRAPDATTARPISIPSTASRGTRLRTSRMACALTAVGDRPSPTTIASRHAPPLWPASRCCEARSSIRPRSGTPQIVLPVARAAGDLDRLQGRDRAGPDDQRGNIEGGMNGVAGARMVEREVEQRLGRQAGAGAAKPDARRGQVPQIASASGTAARRFHHRVTRQGPRPRAAGSNSSRRSADRPRPRART